MSNNNVMVDNGAWRVPVFEGEASHMCCFLHVINLVAKSTICQFDIKRKDADGVLAMSEQEHELNELVGGRGGDDNDDDEFNGLEDEGDEAGDINRGADDNNEGWIDKVQLLTTKEYKMLEKAI